VDRREGAEEAVPQAAHRALTARPPRPGAPRGRASPPPPRRRRPAPAARDPSPATRSRVDARGLALALALALAASGCAGDYVARTRSLREAYEAGRHSEAAEGFAREAKDGSDIDRLLALMDQGMVLHAAGQLEESIRVLAEADRLSQELDVVSVSEEAKALLSSEREKAYRGEDFERLTISMLQALSYAQLGQDESALVEVRRVNERMARMIREEGKPYEQLAIARYLAGALWEDGGYEDDAFIDYQAADELAGDLGPLAEPLVRLAAATGRDEALEALRARYPGVDPAPLGRDEGQLVVVVEAGRVPEKTNGTWDGRERAEIVAIPVFRDRGWGRDATVAVDGGAPVAPVAVTSLERVAKVHLDDRVGRMIARQLASLAVRTATAVAVGKATDSEALGWVTFVALSAVNQPDLRSWLSLPAEFQLARFRLPAGEHDVVVAAGPNAVSRRVTVPPRRVTLVVVRVY
jgi:hypothetical protein